MPALLSYSSTSSFPQWLKCLEEQNIHSLHLFTHPSTFQLTAVRIHTHHSTQAPLSEMTSGHPHSPVHGHFLSLCCLVATSLAALAQTSFTGPFLSSIIFAQFFLGISLIFYPFNMMVVGLNFVHWITWGPFKISPFFGTHKQRI